MIRRIRKHFIKLFIATVVLTTALLFFALRSDYVADKAHHYLLAYLEENLQSKVTMGRPKIAWLWGSWYISDVSIRPDFGKEKREFLTARSVRVSFFPWWNIFKREIGIRFIEVEDPVVYFRIEKGEIASLPNLDFLKGGEGLFRFILKDIRISNGRMDMSYPETPMEMSFSNIDMRIWPDFHNERYGFYLSNSSAVLKVKDYIHKINSLKGKFDITPESLTIKSANLTVPEGKGSTDGFSLNFDTGKWETTVQSSLDLAALKEVAGGQWSVVGKTTIKGDTELTASIKGDDDGFSVTGEAKAGEIELDRFSIKETSYTFSTKGKWDSIKESSLDLELRSKVPVELVNHYFERTPRLKGVADIHIKGSVAGSGGPELFKDLKIEGDAASPRIELAGVQVTKASARFKADREKVNVTDTAVELLGGSLKGELELDLKEGNGFKGSVKVGSVEMSELIKQWSVASQKEISTKVNGKVSGNIDFEGMLFPDMSVNSSSSLQVEGLNISNVKAFSPNVSRAVVKTEFSYGGGVARLRSMDVETPDSKLSVTGDIFDRQLSLGFKLDSSNLSELSIRMKGAATVTGRLSGDIGNPAAEGTLDLKKVSWDRYHADAVSGNVGFKDRMVSSGGLSIREGDSDLFLRGEISFADEHPRLDAQVELKKGRLENILAMADIDLQANGEISLSGKVKGVLNGLDGEVAVKGARMVVMGEEIDTLDIAGRMEKGRLLLQRGEIIRDGDRLSLGGSISSEGDADITVSSSSIQIRSLPFAKKSKAPINGMVELNGRIMGNIRNPSFNGKLALSGIGYRQMNIGDGIIDVSIGNRVLTASGQVFGANMRGSILLRGNSPFNVSVSMKDISLTPYFKGVANLEELTGVITGEMEAHGEISGLKDASARLSLSRLQLVRDPFLLKNTRDIELELKDGRLNVNSFQLSGKGTELESSGWIGTDGETNLLVTGSVDLYILQLFTKAIEKGAGVADVRLSISGKLSKVEGNVFVKDGVIGFKKFDPILRDITGNIILEGETLIVETVTGRIGEGRFKGGGTIEMAGLALKRTDISFDIGGLYLAYPRWLPSEVEGTLRLSGEYPSLLISGDMNVVKARYGEKIDWATFLPSFKQRLKEPQAEKEEAGALGIDINFKADRNLIFENNVGKGELKGEVKLKRESGRFGIVGEVEVVSGKVFYKEHEFNITAGVIEFPDPKKMEAVFDFTAEGKIRDYIVQILVQGNTNDFKVTMTSSPPLSELDIASLLSLGLTSKEFQERGGEAPAYGAASLLSREVEGRFKDYIGFNRFHIDPYYSKVTGTTEPKLTVGKDVSDDVQVIYSRGLTGTGEQEVQMEYKLYRNFSVLGGWSSFGESNSGDIGADMKFRFEFR